MGKAGAGEETGSGRAIITAGRLATLLGVPVSILAYLEARVPEIRALVEGRERVYRAKDAVLLAGLSELLYGEGLSFREVVELMRSGGRQKIVERGRRRLAGALGPARSTPRAGERRAIPPDAMVRPKGLQPVNGTGHRTPALSREAASVLSELMECVRLLEAAR
ncbi:MerR family transcriptional regulator [Acuticoccus mangrovi]|uniref:MerR family transcriptional regulator n=1 Tax=Acuticoccus mangrovi TaxID=2796142 RepID=A0A934IPV7_9HYPH|nr:MerR family transcriptional regulator [Acuticoccus mangrovi]MBJ3776496.1 MerR family transcriptional regulator [Acuticoccus mangrovi]